MQERLGGIGMVRGVNRTIIEVNCTEHGVFERAILFLKPGVDRVGSTLRQDADAYVSAMSLGLETPDTPRKPRVLLRTLLLTALACGVGLVLGLVISL